MRDDDTFSDHCAAGRGMGRTDDTPSADPYRTVPPAHLVDHPYPVRHHRGGTAPRAARSVVRRLLSGRPSGRAVAAGLICCLGLVGLTQFGDAIALVDTRETAPAGPAPADRDPDGQAASRAQRRSTPDTGLGPSAAPTAPSAAPLAPSAAPPRPTSSGKTATPSTKSPPKRKAPRKPARLRPVAGLTAAQMANAQVVVRTGLALGVPRRALVIAVATAMQESTLLNLASGVLPESLDLPNQGVGWDHDSVGLFQQRPSAGWGPVDRLMDPSYAAARFYEALLEVPGWPDMALTDAAQAVQMSAFPYAYAQHEDRATQVVAAVLAFLG
jgi:hypothetical protein